MPLTDEEQKVFDRMLDVSTDEPHDRVFLHKLSKALVELTGNETLGGHIDRIAEKL